MEWNRIHETMLTNFRLARGEEGWSSGSSSSGSPPLPPQSTSTMLTLLPLHPLPLHPMPQMASNPPTSQSPIQETSMKPHSQARLLSAIDKCKVCNEPAAKHIHYGAVSCFSCRAFFRRSIQNQTRETYVCRRTQECQITLKTRRNCQFCRYNRCVAVGMKPSWVLSPDERERRFKKNRDRKNKSLKMEPQKDLGLNHAEEENSEQSLDSVCSSRNLSQPSPADVFSNTAERPAAVVTVIQAVCSTAPAAVQMTLQGGFLQVHSDLVTNSTQCSSSSLLQQGPSVKVAGPAEHTFIKQEPASSMISSPCEYKQSSRSSPSQCHVPRSSPDPVGHMPSGLTNPEFTLTCVPSRSVIVQHPQLETRRQVQETPAVSLIRLGAGAQMRPVVQDTYSLLGASQTRYNYYPEQPSAAAAVDHEEDSDYEGSVYSKSSEDEVDFKRNLVLEPEIKFTEEEYNQLQTLVGEHDERYKSVNFGEELIKEMIMCSMFRIPMSASAAISGYRLTVERMRRIANNLNFFTGLAVEDQHYLLKENADLLVSLRGAIFFDSRKKGVNQVLISLGIDDVHTIKTMFAPLMKKEDSMKHIDYKTFNSIQQVDKAHAVEQRYNFLQGKVAQAVEDDITTILLTYIVLFSCDFCPVSNRRKVEHLQEHFIKILQRYIYSKFTRQVACAKFAAALSAVTFIREMADIKKQRAMNQSVKIS